MTDGSVHLRVNGQARTVLGVPDEERLLDTLRGRLELIGTKEGCRTGDCGACTVLVDGRSTLSCLTLTHELPDSEIRTIEWAGSDRVGAIVQAAFEAEGAVQCGDCTPGFVMSIVGRLSEAGHPPGSAELLDDLQGNLCRCTGYSAIVRAVERARTGLR
ncbi:MAG: 2Fe-2S iron-sulfur cluster-binding protein [Thermoplasmata archaeon]|nr:2Fe-2S iron-sulfur cluster-binding protein [Thermoplasmata archaeon]